MSLPDYGFYILCGTAVVLLVSEAVRDPGNFAQTAVFGLTQGAIFALVALGYTMVYGIIELINFAHGDVFTLSAYIGTSILGLFAVTEGSFTALNLITLLIIFPVVMLIMGGINVGIERVAYRPLRNAPRLAPLNILPPWTTTVAGVFFGFKDIFVIVTSAVLVALLAVFINRTKLGKAMRATAQDRDAAQLMGIDINRTISATFFIGAVLAGAGGIIYGLYYNTVYYQLGFRTGLIAFTAAVFGGIGNIPGAAIGGLIIGLTAAFSDIYIGGKWTQVVIFGILIGVLVFRPTGLLGMRVPEK